MNLLYLKKTNSFIRIKESKHLFTLWVGEKGQLIIAKTEKEKVGNCVIRL